MKFKIFLFSYLFVMLLSSCGGEEILQDSDPNLSIGLESVYFYKGQPFTGVLKAVHPNGIVRLTRFKDGLENGRTFDVFPNGSLSAEYFYDKGKSVDRHRGWYASGKPRFSYDYNKDGLVEGEQWDWYEEGNVYRYARFSKGINIGTKVWRKDGKIYSNYTYTPERLYGVVGAKLCFKLKGDESNKKTVINP
jgi:antitoxin component YwqK of YwqJK toxin-antitoxin module